MFHSNIECALNDLVVSNKAITVANAFPVYMRVAGFTEVCHEAVTSFEHAMDKYPLITSKSPVVSAKQMRDLIQEYWLEKLGMFAKDLGGKLCSCAVCGKEIAIGQVTADTLDVLSERPRNKRSSKSKKVKRLSSHSYTEKSFDPYGPSTSALVI
ncbi:hypothetical protein SERLA73DRAFT_182486 [Serpula lacrymans var. lacrymans S7.3]|uniref:Uncharacterized protein n=1 Tax=Serpula lacrymans var. lacrymans (strain S7.3) TaxID=936435 RepID=F8Q087_SERL3|nr:hypothetical protein SERLA73DRAFT_182486 [Serpula lacrymans var. lacrymans S7.3]